MKLKACIICSVTLTLLAIAVGVVIAGNDIDEFRSCSYCGMDRKAYGYSRTIVIYEDGTRSGLCSLNCAVIEMREHKGEYGKVDTGS